MATLKATGYAGAGLVEVVASGDMKIESVKIDPAIYSLGQKDMLEVLLPGAINDALQKVQELSAEYTKKELYKNMGASL